MKGCVDVRDMLHPFVDGELEVAENVALLKHLELCEPCRKRCEQERALKGLVGSCLEECVSEVERRRILTGAFARAERSRWRENLVRVAAVLAIVAGLGMAGMAYAEPCLFKPCPTEVALEAAIEATRHQPLPLVEVTNAFPGELKVPRPCNMEACDGYMFEAPGCAPRPMVRFRCQRSGQYVTYLRVPSKHRLCFHRAHMARDGRRYATLDSGAMRAVIWYDEKGELRACLAPKEMPEQELYVLASAVRDSET